MNYNSPFPTSRSSQISVSVPVSASTGLRPKTDPSENLNLTGTPQRQDPALACACACWLSLSHVCHHLRFFLFSFFRPSIFVSNPHHQLASPNSRSVLVIFSALRIPKDQTLNPPCHQSPTASNTESQTTLHLTGLDWTRPGAQSTPSTFPSYTRRWPLGCITFCYCSAATVAVTATYRMLCWQPRVVLDSYLDLAT